MALNFTAEPGRRGAPPRRPEDAHARPPPGRGRTTRSRPRSTALSRGWPGSAGPRSSRASFGDDPERERALVEAFTRRRVDGLILTTISDDHTYLQTEREQGVPIVFVDRPPRGLLADAVLTDNGRLGHRRSRTCSRTATAGSPTSATNSTISTARERRRGFDDAMRRAGLDPVAIRSALRLSSRPESERTRPAASGLMALRSRRRRCSPARTSSASARSGRCTASVCSTRWPWSASTTSSSPTCSSPRSPWWPRTPPRSARLAAAAAVRPARRRRLRRSETIVVPTELIVRGSGEIPPSGRVDLARLCRPALEQTDPRPPAPGRVDPRPPDASRRAAHEEASR